MGVPITGTITTTDPSDTFAAIDPAYGIDGWRSVADTTARNAITTLRRRQGMAVWVQAGGGSLWTLNAAPWAGDDTDWSEFTGGGGGGGILPMGWVIGVGQDAVVAADIYEWYIIQAGGTFTQWDLVAKTGPVGADLIFDILLSTDHGATFTSLFAAHSAYQPTIADGSVYGSGTSFDTTSFSAGDLLRLDVTQVGSSTAGANITLRLLGSLS